MKFILPVGWTIAMSTMLLLPGSSIPDTGIDIFPNLDKLVHFFLFSGLVFFWALYIWEKYDGKTWRTNLLLLTLGAISFGIIMEFIQGYLIISRSFDPVDILANSLGAISAALLVFKLKGKD